MATDALLAYAHFLAIFALASVLTAEHLLLRPTMPADIFRRLRLVDRWYGIIAGLVILTGLARMTFGLKPVLYYTSNPVFWTKMALFVAVGLLSIAPTLAYIRWTKQIAADGSLALDPPAYNPIRMLVRLQLLLFVFIPLCAVFMARGFHFL